MEPFTNTNLPPVVRLGRSIDVLSTNTSDTNNLHIPHQIFVGSIKESLIKNDSLIVATKPKRRKRRS